MNTAYATPDANPLRKASGRKRLPDVALDIALVWLICGTFLNVLGPVAPLMVVSGAAALILFRPEALPSLAKGWPLLILGVLAPASALWSDEPAVSLRYGFQLLVTVIAVMIAAATTGPTRYLRALFIASVIILILCVLSGRQGQSQGGMVLIGVLGSKNAMGQLCMLVICASLTMVISQDQPSLLRKAAIATGLLGLLVLVRTFATGAALSTLIFVVAFILLAMASRLTASAKFLFLLVVLVAVAPFALIQGDLVRLYEWFLVDVLNKDIGLTGRDYLWHHADALIQAKPVLGHGYRSIWLGHSSETIGLLRWAGLDSGLGFNFHNTFRESLVDFGFVGTGVVFVTLGVGFVRLLLRSVSQPSSPALWFLAAMGIVTIIRSYAETLLGSFGDTALIVFGVSMFGYLIPARRP